MRSKITKTVWILSLVSLFTDIASEMLYPVMPIYLQSIGFTALLIGSLEGLAEAVAGFSKGYFGNLSDRIGKRTIFVRIGYSLSAISKPMIAFFTYPLWIFLMRTIDRLGKGVRTSARDALLSDEASKETKGRVFGFHRALDTFGAFLGPIAALAYLYFNPDDYISLFYFAFIPGIISISLSFFIKEKKHIHTPSITKKGFLSFIKYWKYSSVEYKKLVIGLFFFALINSSDVFLLLMVKYIGYSGNQVIITYIFYNLIYAIFSFPVGVIADKIGLKKIFIFGLTLFAIVYGGMTLHPPLYIIFVLFFLYGIYASATESIAKAWITNISERKDTATAIGFFTGISSVFTFFASLLAGFLWYKFNPSVTFGFSSIGAGLLILYFLVFVKTKPQH
ncbi:MAG: MFS transporter [Ignavibacteria bacterium]|nr:MFS transporter [Ignavibacteria bacterium]